MLLFPIESSYRTAFAKRITFIKPVNKAGIMGICLHQLRHTFATRCLEAQSDILVCEAMLAYLHGWMLFDTYVDSMIEQRVQVKLIIRWRNLQ